MAYKRILTVQDISCVGQCSMTVAMPILSAWGHETCVLPTALLSTHTGGFGKPAVVYFDDALEPIRRHWQENGITFDAILIGYLGSLGAVEAAKEMIDTMLSPGGISIVDPAMADHGKLYSGFDEAYVEAMKGLCRKADILLPNRTEAALLSGNTGEKDTAALLKSLEHPSVILTGSVDSPEETGVTLWDGCTARTYSHRRIGKSYHGTGDIFAACFTGALMQGLCRYEAMGLAANLTCAAIENTAKNPAHWYGVKFETILPKITELVSRICNRADG